MKLAAAILAAISLAGTTSAHFELTPGSPEFIRRDTLVRSGRRALGACQSQLAKRGGVYERARARREMKARQVREKRSLADDFPFVKRDFETVLNTSHISNLTDANPSNSSASDLFSGNSSCVLGPDTTEGPYYVDGEYVRYDLREEQAGVDLYVDVQLIDVDTCEPVSNVFIDYWHCNSTGVYSGVVASGNGNSLDESNLNATWLRGIQETDSDGVAQFLSIFPGHYTGRATHIHIIAHDNGTQFDNGTYTSATVAHVGQIFFDQDLINTVEALTPYSSNTQNLTLNADDMIMQQEAETIDPIAEYVLLGNSTADGIFAWIAFGINTTEANTVSAASTLTVDGSIVNANASVGSPGGPGGLVSGVPSGSAPPLPSTTA